jgi:hypothetical protein
MPSKGDGMVEIRGVVEGRGETSVTGVVKRKMKQTLL